MVPCSSVVERVFWGLVRDQARVRIPPRQQKGLRLQRNKRKEMPTTGTTVGS